MSVDQHPIPQQITNYEFKLIGDMTLNQFARAAGGILLALLINASPLVFFVKYPLAFGLAAGGLALAFVPLGDRPLEKWVLAFIKSLYSPTLFTWQKKVDPNWLQIDWSKKLDDKDEEESVPKKDKDKVQEFVSSLPARQAGQLNKDIEPETPLAISVEKPILEKSVEILTEKTDLPIDEEVLARDWSSREGAAQVKSEKLKATGMAVFGAIPMPDKPVEPNMLVGMVTDKTGKIVEGAIVEILDTEGNSSRVLKTNSLGQFKTATPLTEGKYLLITEKEGLTFDRVNVDALGKIVEPVKIQAQS